ncbi:MAG: CDP-glycerol glycerophosphotransferase family protein [Clostridiales bacterium]|nr:CDP-glycerol glycerophosphotransferase family protein [Clostridiales bacterium]
MRLYIDPGTGSMLFAILIGLLGVIYYFFKGILVKLRFILSGGKKGEKDAETLPLVIFSDDKRYWPVFEPVCRELDSRGFDVVYMTASEDDPALKNTYSHISAQFIGDGNRAFAKLNFLNATILLSTTPGLDVYQWKRSKNVKYYVHMLHTPTELTTYRMFGTDYYDALLLSGQYQIDDARNLEKLRDLPAKELVLIGNPYLDVKAEQFEKAPKAEPHGRTVLLAPSWGSNSILNLYGSRVIRILLETGYHVILRPHPQSFKSEKPLLDSLMAEFPESEQLEWNRDTDNFAVLNRSDIMISDFSGVIFDFAFIFDKPVICAYTDFDKSAYDAWWLETPIWSATAIPRIGTVLSEENLPNLKSLIDQAIEDKSFAQSRREARDETWVYRGEGAKRAADYLVSKYQELTFKKD